MTTNNNQNSTATDVPAVENEKSTDSKSKIFDQEALKQYFITHNIAFKEVGNSLRQNDKADIFIDDQYRQVILGDVRLNGDFNADSINSFRANDISIKGDFVTNARSIRFDRLIAYNVIVPQAELIKGNEMHVEALYANEVKNVFVRDCLNVDKDFIATKVEVIMSENLCVDGKLIAGQVKLLADRRKIGDNKQLPFQFK
jgi:hypothetical protein